MSSFICERCGSIDNSALSNNYWVAFSNKKEKDPKDFFLSFKEDYFNTHMACAKCCEGIHFSSGEDAYHRGDLDFDIYEHWTVVGKERMLELCSHLRGDYENAKEFFEELTEERILEQLQMYVEYGCKSRVFDFSRPEEIDRYIELNKFDGKIEEYVRKNFPSCN